MNRDLGDGDAGPERDGWQVHDIPERGTSPKAELVGRFALNALPAS